HELQIIGIIDDARRIGVLEIHRQREMMLAADEAATVGGVEVGGHLPSAPTSRIKSPWPIAKSARCMPQPGRNMPNTATSPPMRSVRLSPGLWFVRTHR